MVSCKSFPYNKLRQAAQAGAATLLLAGGGMATAAAAPVPTMPAASSCTDVDVVAARGTFEAPGLGVVVGQPVYSALKSALPGRTTSAYAVDYPASLIEPASVQQGNKDLVDHLNSQAAACPQQKFVLVGYSQGANVVDNSIGISAAGATVGGPIVATIPDAVQPRIAAILLFGNPIRALGQSVTGPYAARTDDFCAFGDPICQPGGTIVAAHLTYGSDATAAAAFAAGRL